jgi:cobyrinic acid a,c-diamide synthase
MYLGGGYPELYADALIHNTAMLDGIRAFAKAGKPVYAECGGMIYLGQSLTLLDGRVHAMAGVLPLAFEMTQRLVHFGYVEVTFNEDCVLGAKGTRVRGHSFHYSRAILTEGDAAAYRLKYKLSGREEVEGFCCGNLLASYVHLHFRANPSLAAAFVASAEGARKAKVSCGC